MTIGRCKSTESSLSLRDSGINKPTPGRVVTSVAVPERDGDGSDVAALEQFDHAFSQVPDRHKYMLSHHTPISKHPHRRNILSLSRHQRRQLSDT